MEEIFVSRYVIAEFRYESVVYELSLAEVSCSTFSRHLNKMMHGLSRVVRDVALRSLYFCD